MNKETAPRVDLQAKIFRKALPLRMTLQEIMRVLKVQSGERCLNVGDEGGLFGYHLRKLGGTWATVVSGEEEAGLARELLEDDVHVMEGKGALPFKDKTFDVVVVINFLERMKEDDAFIEECHRVLKNDGRMVVNVTNRKAATPINPLRRLLGQSVEKRGLATAGYSEPEMFRILKHGFDVSSVRTYMRFFVVLVDTLVKSGLGNRTDVEGLEKAARRYTVAAPFYWLGFQLDLFLFLTKGFSLICTAKRRAWLPRKTPVLSDGRSISEAVLSRPFG